MKPEVLSIEADTVILTIKSWGLTSAKQLFSSTVEPWIEFIILLMVHPFADISHLKAETCCKSTNASINHKGS